MPTDAMTAPLDDISLHAEGKAWTLVLTRRIAHPREHVWAALTERDRLAQWGPVAADRDLDRTGPVGMTERETPGAIRTEAEVLAVDPPAVLEYTWGADVLRWELADDSDGTTLVLRHRFADRSAAASYAAGWHICLDALASLLAGWPGRPRRPSSAAEPEPPAGRSCSTGTSRSSPPSPRWSERPIGAAWPLRRRTGRPTRASPRPRGRSGPGSSTGRRRSG